MSSEPDFKAVPEGEILELLRRVGHAPFNEPDADEGDERGARLAAGLDAQIERLYRERRRARRSRALLLSLAAALTISFCAVLASQRPGSVLALKREPVPSHARTSVPAVSVPSALAPHAATKVVLPPKNVERAPLAPVAGSALNDAGATTSGSTLGEENRLFRDAVNDAHAGRVRDALHGFEQLLHDYPRSPLAQTALVRKFRVLSAAGVDAEARAEARRYLQLYPTGFAQGEARAVASGEPPPKAADAGNDLESP